MNMLDLLSERRISVLGKRTERGAAVQQQPHYPEAKRIQNRRPFWHIFKVFSTTCALLALLSVVSACGGSTSTGDGKITITEMDYWSIPSQSAVLEKLF